MAKLHLPKAIRTDPRLKAVFGSQQRVESKPKQQQPKPTPKGYGSWQQIRMAWVMKQPQRICANPNCKTPYYFPQTVSQKFCCKACYQSFHRKRKEAVPTTCSACGRHSRFLHDGLCSFCYANHRKALYSMRMEKESSRNRCKSCGGVIYKTNSQNIKFKRCSMCLPIVFPRLKCPKCGKESFVTLSTQESSDPNVIIWFCHACSYIFPQSIEVIKNLRSKV